MLTGAVYTGDAAFWMYSVSVSRLGEGTRASRPAIDGRAQN